MIRWGRSCQLCNTCTPSNQLRLGTSLDCTGRMSPTLEPRLSFLVRTAWTSLSQLSTMSRLDMWSTRRQRRGPGCPNTCPRGTAAPRTRLEGRNCPTYTSYTRWTRLRLESCPRCTRCTRLYAPIRCTCQATTVYELSSQWSTKILLGTRCNPRHCEGWGCLRRCPQSKAGALTLPPGRTSQSRKPCSPSSPARPDTRRQGT